MERVNGKRLKITQCQERVHHGCKWTRTVTVEVHSGVSQLKLFVVGCDGSHPL